MRRVPHSPVSYADADQALRRRLPAKWLAAMLITTAVALLAPGVTYVTAGRTSIAAAATTTATTAETTAATTTAATTAAGVSATESFGTSCVHFRGPAG